MQLFSRKLHKLCIKRLNRILYLLYTVFMALVNHSMFIEYTFAPISVHFIAYENVLSDKYTSFNLLIKNQTHRLEKKERNACKPEKVMRSSLSRGRKLWVMDDNKTTEADMRGKTLTVRLSPVLDLSPCGRVHYALYSSAPSKIFSALSLRSYVLHHPLDE